LENDRAKRVRRIGQLSHNSDISTAGKTTASCAKRYQSILDTIVQLSYSPHVWLNCDGSRCSLMGPKNLGFGEENAPCLDL
jgi:hypothetical protein